MDTKSLSRVQIKDADQGIVEAVFSTFDVIDLDGDVTRKGAFTEGAPVVISAYGHRSHDGELPVGKGTIHEVDNQAIMRGQFFLDTVAGVDTFRTVKALSESGLQEWSYSLQNVASERGEFDGKQVRFINSVTVKEVSPVLIGAGVQTRTLGVKRADLKFSEHADAVLADVDALVARAAEVVALRAEKGKSISETSLGLMQQLDTALARLKALIDAPHEESTPIDDEFAREYLRFVALSQGANQ